MPATGAGGRLPPGPVRWYTSWDLGGWNWVGDLERWAAAALGARGLNPRGPGSRHPTCRFGDGERWAAAITGACGLNPRGPGSRRRSCRGGDGARAANDVGAVRRAGECGRRTVDDGAESCQTGRRGEAGRRERCAASCQTGRRGEAGRRVRRAADELDAGASTVSSCGSS